MEHGEHGEHRERLYFDLSDSIIGGAIAVHRALGPGLLESTYKRCLARELDLRGFAVELEKSVPLMYRGEHIECGFRLDISVNNQAIVELKSCEKLLPIHEAQLLTYLRLF